MSRHRPRTAACAWSVLLLALPADARAADPGDLIFADGFEPCDPDPGPYATEATALDRGSITDCDDTALAVAGVLGTDQESDYSRFDGSDTFGCAVGPTLTVAATATVRACLFFQCAAGAAQIECPIGSSPATSPAGRPGCCRSGASFGLAVPLDCLGQSDDDARVFIRLDSAGAVCTSYSGTVVF